MNPIHMAERLDQWLKKRIRSSFPIDNAAPELTPKLDEFFESYSFLQEPRIEITPPYESGASLQKLADDGVILQKTANVFANVLAKPQPDEALLYKHQDEAIREVCKRKSLVVSTGTGSGKTECFLIPIVDHLLRLSDAGKLSDDVHTMILYPMNALVNDQLTRLREILRKLPEIRFGKYTGELPSIVKEENTEISDNLVNDTKCQSENMHSMGLGFDRNLALPNEVTRRSDWRKKPAHILVTNFSMLEYLLLRPEDSSLFGDKWRYIVLDEAHSYNGAMGTEIAWLIRRLINRVSEAGSNRDKMQYIATSATLVSENELSAKERDELIRERFASKIFPASKDKFHYQEGYPCEYRPPKNSLEWSQDAGLNFFNELNNKTVDSSLLGRFADSLGMQKNDTSLFAWMKATNARLKWVNKQRNYAEYYEKLRNGNEVGVCDMDFLLKNMGAVLSLLDIDAVLQVEGENTFKILIQIAECYGAFQDKNIWADILNDPLAPQIYDITDDGGKIHVGNRMECTEEWVHGATKLSFESFHYLLKAALHSASNSEKAEDIDLEDLPVVLSKESRESVDKYANRLREDQIKYESLERELKRIFSELFLKELDCEDASLPNILSKAIGRHPSVVQLNQTLSEMLQSAHQNSGSLSISGIKEKEPKMFGNENDIIDLIDWCCFAKPRDSRHPILDLRYHQLVRGLNNIGIKVEKDTSVIEFCKSEDIGTAGVYPVGVCRDCGQPYVLGFLNQRNPDYSADKRPILSPFKTPDFKYLVALYWEIYDPENDDIINESQQAKIDQEAVSCFFVANSGELYNEGESGIPNHSLKMKLLMPHPQNSTFIPGCARCGGTHIRSKIFEYGIITPITYESTAAKVTILDELGRLVSPSDDPVARNNPGEGRKVLAFSDSRAGASRFAYHFYVDFLETNGKRFLKEGIENVLQMPNGKRAEWLIPDGIRENCEKGDPIWKATIKQYAEQVDPVRISLSELCQAFRKRVEDYNLPDAFSVLGEDGKELSVDEAIRFRIWRQVCDKSRNSIIGQGLITIELPYEVPNSLLSQTNLNESDCRRLINETIVHWIMRKKVSRGANWPQYEQAFGNQSPYVFDKDQYATGPKGKLNKHVRRVCQCNADESKEILITIWNSILLSKGLLIPGVNNTQYQFDFNKIRFSLGNKSKLDPKTPADEYFCNKYSRALIPIRAEEHTAQLSKERGVSYQEGFVNGRVNVLSCSTTFELGIDVGDLSSVFLTNLPPNVARYRQRAGRAGRRAGSAGYSLTFVSSRPYDLYFWENPEQLYIGELPTPQIYIDNPLIRARHLRAEAFHHFLAWLATEAGEVNRIIDYETEDENGQKRPYRRNWKIVGDMLGGLKFRLINKRACCVRRFRPLALLMGSWYKSDNGVLALRKSVKGICSEHLDYDVGADLCFQVTGENAPYKPDSGNKNKFETLGGPNNHNEGSSAIELFREQVRRSGNDIFDDPYQESSNGYQRSRFARQTIEFLTRHGILPKYGFPVDVIELIPDPRDIYGKNVELSRDLRIGLFEYAPQQSVIADKRLYESSNIIGIHNADESPVETVYRCSNCNHISLSSMNTCELCHSNDYHSFETVQPDYFNARQSVADMSRTLQASRGVRQIAFAPAQNEKHQIKVRTRNLTTATPVEPEMYLFNRGVNFEGFDHLRTSRSQLPSSLSLMHKFRTDIIYWMPDASLFDPDFFSERVYPDDPEAVKRRNLAMRGALNAILKSIPLILGIAPNEVDGLLYPMQNHTTSFVLFDNVSGGAGHVQRLRMESDDDFVTMKVITTVLQKAISMFDQCRCAHGEHPELYPLASEEYRVKQDKSGIRQRMSCAKCMWRPGKYRENLLLDAADSRRILEFL